MTRVTARDTKGAMAAKRAKPAKIFGLVIRGKPRGERTFTSWDAHDGAKSAKGILGFKPKNLAQALSATRATAQHQKRG